MTEHTYVTGAWKVDENKVVEVLEDLIRIDSTNPELDAEGVGEAELCCYISNRLKNLGIEVTHQYVTDQRFNVIGRIKGSGNGRSILLNGHTDTVGVKGYVNPFDPVREENKVYGRGSFDMKSGLTMMLMAAETLMKSEITLEGDVLLAFVIDEEYRSIGTEALVKEYRADAAIVCEPSELDLVIAHKGFAWASFEVYGKAAHGSMPEAGIDAILKAGKVLHELDLLTYSLKEKSHSIIGSPSVHASLIQGGKELSTYPDYCRIDLERRTIPGESYQDIVGELEGIVSKIANEDVEFSAKSHIAFFREPFEISQEEPIVKILHQSFVRRLGREPHYRGMGGWCDAALLAEAGIPSLVFGARGDGAHAILEYAEIDSVVSATEILIETMFEFCNGLHS